MELLPGRQGGRASLPLRDPQENTVPPPLLGPQPQLGWGQALITAVLMYCHGATCCLDNPEPSQAMDPTSAKASSPEIRDHSFILHSLPT